MSIPGPAPIVPVMDVLRECGWVADHDQPWSEEPALKYDLGNFEVRAGVMTNGHFRRVVNVCGVYSDHRSIAEIGFDVPLFVESREQALAWVAYGLRRYRMLEIKPDWLEEGRQLQQELPWERRRAAYEARPRACVDRMWMKPLGKVLREAAASASEDAHCLIHFDGSTVRFELPAKTYLVQADGSEPWPHAVLVSLRELQALPQRWMQSTINVSYWDGQVTIGNRRFAASFTKRPGATSSDETGSSLISGAQT